jgi:hypothetical protein
VESQIEVLDEGRMALDFTLAYTTRRVDLLELLTPE